ncbi:MAG: RNA polymerase sigma-70 factor [Flavobacteriales bacterium]|nr:RNA polymerase sigma-70 factor [Flavobacteriales bacterium]
MNNEIKHIEDLFLKYHSELCNTANKIVWDRSNAEDIVQDVFFKLYKIKEDIDWSSSLRAYLHKATMNGAINWLEKNRRLVPISNEVEEPSINDVEQKIETKELQDLVDIAIKNLPPKCRAIFILSRTEGLKYKQIAEQLDISVKTVENQMGIAIKKLKTQLESYITVTSTLLISILNNF